MRLQLDDECTIHKIDWFLLNTDLRKRIARSFCQVGVHPCAGQTLKQRAAACQRVPKDPILRKLETSKLSLAKHFEL